MQQSFYPPQRSDRSAPVRTSFSLANQHLGKGKTLFDLTMASVFCLLCALTLYLVYEMLYVLLYTFTELALPLVTAACITAVTLLSLLLLLPLMLGRVRMCGAIVLGEEPMCSEMFYYFTSPRRFAKGLLLSLLYLLSFSLPLSLSAGAFVGSYVLYREVFNFYLLDAVAILLFIAMLFLSVGFAVLCLYLSSFHFSTVALLAGVSRLTVFGALKRSFLIGKRHSGVIFRYLLSVTLRLLISLCSVGVLWILFYAHQTSLAYWELVTETSNALEREKAYIGGPNERIC